MQLAGFSTPYLANSKRIPGPDDTQKDLSALRREPNPPSLAQSGYRKKNSLRSIVRPLAAIVVLASIAISCSPSGGESMQSPICNTPGFTSDQVTLGFVVSDSGGSSATFASARSGIDARIGLANASGGIHGRRISYHWRDDSGSESRTERMIDELVQQDSVFGLVTASSTIGSSMDRLTELGVPVAGLAAEPSWAAHPNMFSHMYSGSAETIGQYIKAAGGTKIAILTARGTFGTDTAIRYATALQAVGLGTVVTIPYASNSDNPNRVAQQIADSGADAIIGITSPIEFAEVMQATHAAQMQFAASVSLSGYDRSLLDAVGQALAGVSIPVYFRPFEADGEPLEQYRRAMNQYSPQTILPEQQFAMFTYINTDLFLRGLELAGPCPTRQGFISALRNLSDYDAGGLIEPVNLSTNIGKSSNCNAFVQVDPTGREFRVTRESVCINGLSGGPVTPADPERS